MIVDRRQKIWVLGILMLALTAPAQTSAQEPARIRTQDPPQQGIIKVETAYVTVPVMVTDRYGQFVLGLNRSDFTITEDGARQEIAAFSSTEAPFNVALLIDTSHSTKRKLSAIKKAALDFVRQLQPQDKVLIVTFDDRVRFNSDFTSNREDLKRAIEAVKSNYATSLYDAIYMTVNEKLSALDGRKALVVLSDGVDTASRQATYESALDLVSTAGIVSYAIQYETRNDGGPIMKPIFLPPPSSAFNFSPPASSFLETAQVAPKKRDPYLVATEFLRSLALQSGARYLRAETIESTSYAFALIATELRHQYTIAYYSSNETRDGRFRKIEVTIPRADLVVRPRPGYRAPLASESTPKAPPARP